MSTNNFQDVKGDTMKNVLDHGFVRLIDSMGSDLSVVRNARVSYNAAWRAGANKGSDTRLIRYLYNNGHNSPFESITVTFEVKAPIFVIRQWHRHRTWSYNEISARYKELPEEYYVPELSQITTQSSDNKQMRTEELNSEAQSIQRVITSASDAAFSEYRHLLEMGCPRELARGVLPVGTYTHMFATVNLHNLFGFLRERLHPHAQWEIRQYAEAMLELVTPVAPVCIQAFKDKLETFNEHK